MQYKHWRSVGYMVLQPDIYVRSVWKVREKEKYLDLDGLKSAVIQFMHEPLQESTKWSECFSLLLSYLYVSMGTLKSDSLSLSIPNRTKWTPVYLLMFYSSYYLMHDPTIDYWRVNFSYVCTHYKCYINEEHVCNHSLATQMISW